VGIDVRDARVAALEVQPGGRDDAVEQVQRRARHPDALRRRVRRRRDEPHHLVLEARGLAVADETRTGRLHPGLYSKWLRRCAGYGRTRCTRDEGAFEENTAAQKPIAGNRIAWIVILLSSHDESSIRSSACQRCACAGAAAVGRNSVVTVSSPIFRPMSVPTSVEKR